mmetsp:Transcript_147111/g.256731  ORF Transcript_147111/g.256731 Transcript_147111/m.256731 type:complete len:206 (+) Transcript_147111:72-689(+)
MALWEKTCGFNSAVCLIAMTRFHMVLAVRMAGQMNMTQKGDQMMTTMGARGALSVAMVEQQAIGQHTKKMEKMREKTSEHESQAGETNNSLADPFANPEQYKILEFPSKDNEYKPRSYKGESSEWEDVIKMAHQNYFNGAFQTRAGYECIFDNFELLGDEVVVFCRRASKDSKLADYVIAKKEVVEKVLENFEDWRKDYRPFDVP